MPVADVTVFIARSMLVTVQPLYSVTPCFTYQTAVVNGTPFVLDVAITLTVRTQDIDPVTRQFLTETKTLLNVAPRNVFNTWELASIGEHNRVQPMPPSIQTLIGQ